MIIEIIDKIQEIEEIKDSWDFIYNADPKGQFFLSWTWLHGKLKRYTEYQEPWFIIAVKQDKSSNSYVAFLPVLISVKEAFDNGINFYCNLSIAGRGEADNIGFICLPEYAKEAIISFVEFFQRYDHWSAFEMENILKSDQRIHLFLSSFSRDNFELHNHRFVNDLDNIDCSIIPYISLPKDWDEYLKTFVSSNTRQKIRRFLRKVEGSDEFRVTQVDESNLDQHLDILLKYWYESWKGRKGIDICKRVVDQTNFTLRHCFKNNSLYLPILWQGDKPLGAIANLIDHQKKSIFFLMAGRDETAKKLPSGLILHAYGIQYAIQNKFKVYDFLMGNEAYKYSFGVQERHITQVVIHRKHLNNKKPQLDIRAVPKTLKLIGFYHRANRLDVAERGYRQVLEVVPKHPIALYGLSVVMQRQGDYGTAERLLKELIQIEPKNIQAWFSLGTLQQTQGQLSAAEQAYRQALSLQPKSSAISLALHHNLGYTLQQQDRLEEAIAYYQKARELHPDSIEAEVMWANALYAQGTLPAEKHADYAHMNCELGDKRTKVSDLKVAVEYYRQAITIAPDCAQAHCHLGVVLHKQGEYSEAIASYQKAMEIQPQYPEAEASLSYTQHIQGQLSPEQQLHYATFNDDLGKTFQSVGQLENAIEYYRQAIAMNPELVDTHLALGHLLKQQDKPEEAIAYYQKAKALRPDNIEAEVSWANILHEQSKLGFEQRKAYAAMNLDVGHQCKQAGDLERAIAHYRQAILMNPDLTEIRGYLRQAMQEQDNGQVKVSCAKS